MAPSTRSEDWSEILEGYVDYFSTKRLPTKRDILLEYEKRKSEIDSSYHLKFNEIKLDLINKLSSIYEKVPQKTIQSKSIENKLKNLITQYDKITKFSSESSKVKNFRDKANSLFNISYCTCQMKSEFSKGLMVCSCPADFKILESEYEFISDQRSLRRMEISDQIDAVTTRQIQAKCLRREYIRQLTEDDEKVGNDDVCPSSSSNYVIASKTRKINKNYEDMDTEQRPYGDENYVPNLKARKVEKVKLMDETQCHTADKKAISNRGLATVLKNDANKVNQATSCDVKVVPSSKSTIHRKRIKCRDEHLIKMERAISEAKGPFQLMFDGKKIDGKERMVVVVQYVNEKGEKIQDFFRLKTFKSDESITGECLFDTMVEELFDNSFLRKVICSMSDTTAVNTGVKKGINTRLRCFFKKHIGRDLHTFECLLHVNELYLTHFIKFYESDTKAPNKMQHDSIYNLIEELEPLDLTEEKMHHTNTINKIKIMDSASKTINEALTLASLWKTEQKSSVFRDDHLRMLTLAAKVYRQLPENLGQYLYHRQETISQSRWCTTASGYLRLFLFDVFELDNKGCEKLRMIVSFIVNVYVPVFIKINLHPKITQGPEVVLFTRDLLKGFGVPETVKDIFLHHAEQWLSPMNVSVVVHQENPPLSIEDIKKVRVTSVNTRELCWSNRKVRSFFTVESAFAPCISIGSSDFWRSIDNHNRSCERYIGKMALVLKKGWVRDSGNVTVDSRVRGYVLNMENDLKEQ